MSAHPPLTLKQRIERSRLVHGGEEEGDDPESAYRATAAGGGGGYASNATTGSFFKPEKRYTRKISRV